MPTETITLTELIQTIARLRRDMPRNKLAMDLCDAAEQLAQPTPRLREPLSRAEIQKRYRKRKKEKKDV